MRFGAALLDSAARSAACRHRPRDRARVESRPATGWPFSPPEDFDSESLLRHPRLERLAGNRMLLVKGSGGRDLLQRGTQRAAARGDGRRCVSARAGATSEPDGFGGARGAFRRRRDSRHHGDQRARLPPICWRVATPGAARRLRARALGRAERARRGRACASAGCRRRCCRRPRPRIRTWWPPIVRWRASESGA